MSVRTTAVLCLVIVSDISARQVNPDSQKTMLHTDVSEPTLKKIIYSYLIQFAVIENNPQCLNLDLDVLCNEIHQMEKVNWFSGLRQPAMMLIWRINCTLLYSALI